MTAGRARLSNKAGGALSEMVLHNRADPQALWPQRNAASTGSLVRQGRGEEMHLYSKMIEAEGSLEVESIKGTLLGHRARQRSCGEYRIFGQECRGGCGGGK